MQIVVETVWMYRINIPMIYRWDGIKRLWAMQIAIYKLVDVLSPNMLFWYPIKNLNMGFIGKRVI